MEEEGVAKAPVTRLRRRLSVETEDVKSPSTPSTPNKKRGGRLAAKPQLELIDENATHNVPKRSTRKSIAKDIIEATEERALTPSRRSARIKSNTSIVSDTAPVVDSPRAKRVARRNSQIGSDNEAPSTPIRATRRTRKDSTPSKDNQADTTGTGKIEAVAEVIFEEAEDNGKEDSVDSTKINTSLRKSPRLTKKDNKKRSSLKSDADTNEDQKEDIKQQPEIISASETKEIYTSKQNEEIKSPKQINLSLSTTKLLNNLQTTSKKSISDINKSTSALEMQDRSKKKRSRTKSWSTVASASPNINDAMFFSDNENTKKHNKSKLNVSVKVNGSRSGDKSLNNSATNHSVEIDAASKSALLCPQETTEKDANLSKISQITDLIKAMDESNQSNKENISSSEGEIKKSSSSTKLFDKAPISAIQLYIEESDSNTGSIDKNDATNEFHGEDQCVPVVDQPLDNKNEQNDSCEPMDIDETIPGHITVDFSEKKTTSFEMNVLNSSRRKSSVSLAPDCDISTKSTNESRTNSLSSRRESQNPEKSTNESKSTLLLSQMKDISTNDSVLKSPKVRKNDSIQLNSRQSITKGKDPDSKNNSLTYSTSTPLQQKPLKKLMQINSPIVSSQEIAHNKNKSKSNKSQIESSEEESDDESESREMSEMLDNEAMDAGDDYESGDSRDEDERQYAEENEIREKGETLESEEELSDDSDYEKDSFVVSSDEEDDDLLSGSGDDLSMSDNELSMSAKSKKKFNERKEKERKKASKEMYEARHNMNNSDSMSKTDKKVKKSNRQRLDSTLLDSDSDDSIKQKKGKRLRIDSSQDVSTNFDEDEVKPKSEKKTKRLSESLNNESVLNEKEITVNNQSTMDKSDPLVKLKQEPKTPQRDSTISAENNTDTEEVEEVQVNQNISVQNQNETSDPLQTTMGEESSSSSDNNEIMDNYDSMLNELNNDVKNKRAKLWDTSLNLNKTTKKKPEHAIVDQLNLTVAKQTKKAKNVITTEFKEKTQDKYIIKPPAHNSDEENSSDSIDMRLLFPEDSNDSEATNNKSKSPNKDEEDFIPLKRTEASTDITDSKDKDADDFNITANTVGLKDKMNASMNNSLKQSSKKNKNSNTSITTDAVVKNDESVIEEDTPKLSKKNKRKSSLVQSEDAVTDSVGEEGEIKFFVDTEGTGIDTNTSVNISVQGSSKKKKNKVSLVNPPEDIISIDESKANDESPKLTKKKNKRKSSLVQSEDVVTDGVGEADEVKFFVDTEGTGLDTNTSVNISVQGSSKKKKNKVSLVNPPEDIISIDESKANDESPKSNKKKNKRKSSLSMPEDTTAAVSEVEQVNFFEHTKGAELETTANVSVQDSSKKKKNKKGNVSLVNVVETVNDGLQEENTNKKETTPKKRKRKISLESPLHDTDRATQDLNNSGAVEKQNIYNKKRKISPPEIISKQLSGDVSENEKQEVAGNQINKPVAVSVQGEETGIRTKKRKRKDNDDIKVSKVLKDNSFDDVHVSRLPASIINQLDDKPKAEELLKKKSKVISTTQFVVEEAKKMKSKPSNYLEDSIHIGFSPQVKKQKSSLKKPKVLPFIPTASTSSTGFTTNFVINPMPVAMKFTAQSSDIPNFKNDYLNNRRVKKMGTYEMYKRRRNVNVSKF